MRINLLDQCQSLHLLPSLTLSLPVGRGLPLSGTYPKPHRQSSSPSPLFLTPSPVHNALSGAIAPTLFARRVRLDDGEDYEYEDGAFWVSIGVLAVLDIVVATLYISAAVRAFR